MNKGIKNLTDKIYHKSLPEISENKCHWQCYLKVTRVNQLDSKLALVTVPVSLFVR